MLKGRKIWVLCLLAAILTPILYFLLLHESPIKVRGVALEEGDISSVYIGYGHFEASDTSSVSAPSNGSVKTIHVQEGQVVATGDMIVSLSDDELLDELSALRIDLKKHKRELAFQRKKLKALKALDSVGGISKNEVSDLIHEIELTKLAKAEVKAKIDTTKQLKLKRAIVSPIDGVITAVKVKRDEWVNQGVELVEITDPKDRKIKLLVDALDIGRISANQNATISSDVLPGKTWLAKVAKISPIVRANGVSNSVSVELEFVNEVPEIRVGQQVDVEIETDHRSKVLKLPLTLLVNDSEHKYVYVYDNGRLRRQAVELGVESFVDAEVLSGLSITDIVVYPSKKLNPNGKYELVNFR